MLFPQTDHVSHPCNGTGRVKILYTTAIHRLKYSIPLRFINFEVIITIHYKTALWDLRHPLLQGLSRYYLDRQ